MKNNLASMTKRYGIRPLLASALAVVAVTVCGCGGKGGVPVTGTVTFEGQPVEAGAISFVPTDGHGVSEGAVITKGEFNAVVTPGAKRVEIRASRPVAPSANDPDAKYLREDFIPARFNDSSQLTAEVSADHENSMKFDLR